MGTRIRWNRSSEYKRHKEFDSKRYWLHSSVPTKSGAKALAKKLRSKGTTTYSGGALVRITESQHHGGWLIWLRARD